jgi:diguanylate cyclase (GGDEF)-like protein
MYRLEPAKLHQMLADLEQATRYHTEWRERLIGMLLCQLPSDPNDLREDSHRRCRFGRWYYGKVPKELQLQPTFAAIEAEHRGEHQLAARLLAAIGAGNPIVRADYDELVAGNARLRLMLDALRNEAHAALRGTDPLTGAYARSALMPELLLARELVKRGTQQCCIAFMDLDRFKLVNDRFGHAAGDRLLTGAIRCVTENLRPYDKVFRYGGDEFLIVLPATSLADGESATERIRRTLGTTKFDPGNEGRPLRATASFGLALIDPDVSVEEAVERADTALLTAKSAGRNRTVTWNPEITTSRGERILQLPDTVDRS